MIFYFSGGLAFIKRPDSGGFVECHGPIIKVALDCGAFTINVRSLLNDDLTAEIGTVHDILHLLPKREGKDTEYKLGESKLVDWVNDDFAIPNGSWRIKSTTPCVYHEGRIYTHPKYLKSFEINLHGGLQNVDLRLATKEILKSGLVEIPRALHFFTDHFDREPCDKSILGHPELLWVD